MKNPQRVAVQRLKRKRKIDARRIEERRVLASGKIIMFGAGNKVVMERHKPKTEKKPKVVKPLPAYRAVKLTQKLDKLTAQIRDMDSQNPKLESLKIKRDIIKKKLGK